MEAALAERAATLPAEAPCCAHCGQPQRLVGKTRTRELHGLVGDYVLRREISSPNVWHPVALLPFASLRVPPGDANLIRISIIDFPSGR